MAYSGTSDERQIDLDKLYQHSRKVALTVLEREEPDLARRVPVSCPWQWEQVVDRSFWPEEG
ncbi:hypothetical protein WCLP8_260005 [uncultured Gammaproteobacteria bacterium]